MITALDMTQKVGPYHFGLDKNGAAKALRELADKLESGAAHLQGATSYQLTALSDYSMQVLVVKFLEKNPA